MAFCGNCGAEIEQGAKFCGGCGNPILVQPDSQFKTAPPPTIEPSSGAPVQEQKKMGRHYIILTIFIVVIALGVGHAFFGKSFLSILYKDKVQNKQGKPEIAKPSPQKKIPEQERSVYSKPTPIEPPRVIPEVKMGIPYIGVEIQNLTKEVADSVGLLEGSGVLVRSVKPGGPAALAGIFPGDVILRFKDTWVTDARILSELVKSTPSGTSSPVYIDRRGKRYHLTLVIGGLKKEDLSLTPTPPPSQQVGVQNRQYYETGAKQAFDYKDFQKLRHTLDEGLTYYPDSGTLWSYEGAYYYFYKDSGPLSFRREKALKASKKAVQIEPSGRYYFNLGSVYLGMFQDYSSALDCYEKTGNYALSDPSVYYHMARCYEELRYLNLAVSHYEKFLQAAPNDQFAQDARNRLARLR